MDVGRTWTENVVVACRMWESMKQWKGAIYLLLLFIMQLLRKKIERRGCSGGNSLMTWKHTQKLLFWVWGYGTFRKEGLRGFGYGCEILGSATEPEKFFECCQLISHERSAGMGELTWSKIQISSRRKLHLFWVMSNHVWHLKPVENRKQRLRNGWEPEAIYPKAGASQ